MISRRRAQKMLVTAAWSQPNNLLLSGGLFPAAGSRLQADAGVTDKPETWLEDLRSFAGASCNERIATSVAEFIPEMAGAPHSGAPSQNGSTMALARAWGAALGGMDGYQGQGHTHPDGRTRLGMSIPTLGGIMLNREGRRFVREDIGPSALAAKVLAQPGQQALEVFDEAIEQRLGNHSAYAPAREAGRVIEADDLEALARQAGVPLDALRESVQLAQHCAQGLATDPLGRTHFAQPLAAPFRASWVTGSLAHTQGGLLVDGDGRVLDTEHRAMEGVYAAGGCAAGLSGHGGDGYLPGNGLAQSFGLALRAVDHLAEILRH